MIILHFWIQFDTYYLINLTIKYLVFFPDVVKMYEPVPPLQSRQLGGLLGSGPDRLTGSRLLNLPRLTVGWRLSSFLGIHSTHNLAFRVWLEYLKILNNIDQCSDSAHNINLNSLHFPHSNVNNLGLQSVMHGKNVKSHGVKSMFKIGLALKCLEKVLFSRGWKKIWLALIGRQ